MSFSFIYSATAALKDMKTKNILNQKQHFIDELQRVYVETVKT